MGLFRQSHLTLTTPRGRGFLSLTKLMLSTISILLHLHQLEIPVGWIIVIRDAPHNDLDIRANEHIDSIAAFARKTTGSFPVQRSSE